MSALPAARPEGALHLPAAPALALGAARAVWLSVDGELETLDLVEAGWRAARQRPLVVHARAVQRRLELERLAAFDLLELVAFVRPARFCVPTARGLARLFGLRAPARLEDEPAMLHAVARALLRELSARRAHPDDPAAIAWAMGGAGWPWASAVLAALGQPLGPGDGGARAGLEVWRALPEWQDQGQRPQPRQHGVEPQAARRRLAQLVAAAAPGRTAEPRPQQADYASAVSLAFRPREEAGVPHVVLAEAGTGVGKTLGYLAPATVWAEINDGAVWVSTYTRNLQHQIDGELDRLWRDPAKKAERVVLRKGRENYLCLLNLEEAVRVLAGQPALAVPIGLMLRWTAHSRDGDLNGPEFPGWLAEIGGRGRTLGLADRRGECIHSACDHYRRCFIERSQRLARHARIVVANHALVMMQAALGGGEERALPTRYVFDEGHHLFEAADSAFSAHLTGAEGQELRRWLAGPETAGGRSRMRGLARRMEGVLPDAAPEWALVTEILAAARALPGEAWPQRVSRGQPQGPAEAFLALLRRQVYARSDPRSPYSLECEPRPPVDGLLEAAAALDGALSTLARPLAELIGRLKARLDDEAETLDSDSRRRLDALARGLARRSEQVLAPWRAMLQGLDRPAPVGFVDWFGVERVEGRDVDLGYHRHHLDPTAPFAESVLGPAHGAVITSATLTDGTGDPELDWQAAVQRSGAAHLPAPALRAQVPSPFDHARQTRVVVVTDVDRDDADQVAAAYRVLFLAAAGGALGLFTAVQRLRQVHQRIAVPLEEAGLTLHAQHLDGLDVGTLIDIFRAEEDACLLGTDAVRDGVDVPGRALRLIVFDRVPWPRPSILMRERTAAFGGRRFTEMLTRLRLKQAYGRLVRRADDRGVFVMLDPQMPSRFARAFPPGVLVERLGLAQATGLVREFLQSRAGGPAEGAAAAAAAPHLPGSALAVSALAVSALAARSRAGETDE